ncbi:MAG: radical SAM protein, partial [Oscillospiraceae bacterium]|nr:radical SAM protein [Oscillospiraceae bacterium]
PLEECLAEARWLAEEGVKELVVVAQDVTAYGDDWGENQICRLLEELNKIKGIAWIRLLYAYPERITDEFIDTMAKCEKIVPYLDLPIQHSNDEVLKAMNRKSDRATIDSAVRRLREKIPGITLRTTLIAGFPGETQEQFEEMCRFMKDTAFDRLGCFAYSAEENTVAGRMENQWDEETKQERADIVMRTQSHIMAAKQAAKVGQTLTVLSDGYDEESGLYLCRTQGDAPEIDGCVCVQSDVPLYPGEFYQVYIEDSDEYDLYGVLA